MFLVGANASGKSNLLDVFRFLRDIAKQGGGLQFALSERGGLSPIRCLAARRFPDVEIRVEFAATVGGPPLWSYHIGIGKSDRGGQKPRLTFEKVWKGESLICERPDSDDKNDDLRLTQTHLEQISANARFRDIATFFENVTYLHLVPQLLRFSQQFTGPGVPGDPFGQGLLERIGRTPERRRRSRLKQIENALTLAVPQLNELAFIIENGSPHLEATYKHWRPHGAKQRERDFSDGTLRLLALLWSLLESDSLLLLEEPELSLNAALVRQLAPMIWRLQRKHDRQVIASTHSADLLNDKGIAPEEVLLLLPGTEGTEVKLAASIEEVRAMLEEGHSVADAVLPRTSPPLSGRQLSLF